MPVPQKGCQRSSASGPHDRHRWRVLPRRPRAASHLALGIFPGCAAKETKDLRLMS
jgi:hypothetical protein